MINMENTSSQQPPAARFLVSTWVVIMGCSPMFFSKKVSGRKISMICWLVFDSWMVCSLDFPYELGLHHWAMGSLRMSDWFRITSHGWYSLLLGWPPDGHQPRICITALSIKPRLGFASTARHFPLGKSLARRQGTRALKVTRTRFRYSTTLGVMEGPSHKSSAQR